MDAVKTGWVTALNAMNTMSLPVTPVLELLEIIDLKWLLAHEGHRVHVEQLQTDPTYARQCLALGLASGNKALQTLTRRLCTRLGLDPNTAAPHSVS
jgi:hypothetical protein